MPRPLDLLRSPRLLALWLLVRVAGRLPAPLLDGVATVLGTLLWYLAPGVRAVTRDHMRHVLGPLATPAEVDRAARGCARADALYYAAFARGPHEAAPQPFEAAQGLHHITDAAAHGHGVILLSAHLGNPESISATTAALGLDLVVLTEPLHPRALHDFVHAVRHQSQPGVRFVPADLPGLRLAFAHLQCGGALAVLGDRDVLGRGVPLTFFGERALLPGGIADLALRTGAPVVPGFALRTRQGGIRAVVEPPLDLPRTGDDAADLAEARRQIVTALERGIALAPDQWFPLAPVWSGLSR